MVQKPFLAAASLYKTSLILIFFLLLFFSTKMLIRSFWMALKEVQRRSDWPHSSFQNFSAVFQSWPMQAINAQLDLCEDEDISVSTSSCQRFACCGCETRKQILTLLVHLSWFPGYRSEGRLSKNCPVSHQERIYPESQTSSHSCCRQVVLASTKTLVFRQC